MSAVINKINIACPIGLDIGNSADGCQSSSSAISAITSGSVACHSSNNLSLNLKRKYKKGNYDICNNPIHI
jgi:hypothetical protein